MTNKEWAQMLNVALEDCLDTLSEGVDTSTERGQTEWDARTTAFLALYLRTMVIDFDGLAGFLGLALQVASHDEGFAQRFDEAEARRD